MTLIEHEAREYSDMRYIIRKAEMSLTLPWLKPRDSCELGLLGFRRYV